LTLDDDLFVEHPAALAYSSDFAQMRQPSGGKMSRLYAVESRFSVTGSMADHRLGVRSEQIAAFVWTLTGAVARAMGAAQPELAAYKAFATPAFLSGTKQTAFVRALAQDLVAAKGRSAITAGAGQPPEVHALVHQLNAVLGSVGKALSYTSEFDGARPAGIDALTQLSSDMAAGRVASLFILGGNPVFMTPTALKFEEALKQVKYSVHLSTYNDETSHATSWHLPRTHYLEAWGDARAFDGSMSIVQPLIEPLYKTRTPIEVLSLMLGEERRGQALVRTTFGAQEGGELDDVIGAHWRQALHDGVVANSATPKVTPTRQALNVAAPAGKLLDDKVDNGSLEVTFWADSHVYDGRYANNGWLQELPDFMTKLTWDNAAVVAPATAEALGLKHEYMANFTIDGRSLAMPVYIMPGQAPGSIALNLGYGRTHSGHVAGLQKGEVDSAGFNTYLLRHAKLENFARGLQVEHQGRFFELGITQDHHSMDVVGKKGTEERLGEIVREATLETFKNDPEFARKKVEHPKLESLWEEPSYANTSTEQIHKWGMAIDLNSCVGCNACVVACQAENNIPIVGKANVIMGRAMHWIRIDRYFSGDMAAPTVVHQPVTCMQCEMAPCESVCPVAATVHSKEGLNDMVYNRCIGTRYCSNNCPYKVRRFNFFNYHKSLEKPENQVAKMQYNPEVTVRARGVMEKCTYCVQRIQNVKIPARNAKRPIKDGEIVPACGQACPTGAISFGDLNDASSVVAQKHKSSRAYFMLEELNTKPRTAYLARIRNPNPELA
jgi:molybdopterin-containing oxidoreductase family iron-sulfur binding subunit